MSASFSTITQKLKQGPVVASSAALRDAVSKLPLTMVSGISNGFRVATEENPHANFATVGVYMDSGCKYETRGQNVGASKVLELCALKGTTNQSKSQIQKAIDEIGGFLHIEAGVEKSKVYVKCPKDAVPKAVSLLSDIVLNARLSDEDVAEAKAEINVAREVMEEDPVALMKQNLRITAFDSVETGLGNTVLATESETAELTSDLVKAFRVKNYTAPRMVLVGAGAVNQTQMEKLAQEYFGQLPNQAKPVIESTYVGGDIRVYNQRSAVIHMAWAFEGPHAKSGDHTVLNLLKHTYGSMHRSQHELAQHAAYRTMKTYNMLDGSAPMSTILNEKAIETASMFHDVYEDTSLCGHIITTRLAVSDPGHVAETHKEALQYSFVDMNRMAQKAVIQEEIDYGKVNYKSELLFKCDGSTNTVEDIGTQVLNHGRRIPIDEMFNRIDDVTRTNVQESLQHYYTACRPVMSFYGQHTYMPSYASISPWTHKNFTMY